LCAVGHEWILKKAVELEKAVILQIRYKNNKRPNNPGPEHRMLREWGKGQVIGIAGGNLSLFGPVPAPTDNPRTLIPDKP
jgi:hypothetical protein